MPRSLIIFLGATLALIFISGCVEEKTLPPVSTGNASSAPNDEAPIRGNTPSVIVDADSAPVITYSGNSN